MKKILGLFAIAAMSFTLGSCTEDEPEFLPAPEVAQLPVFFSLENETNIEVFESTTSFDVPVYRKTTEGEQIVDVAVEITPDANGFSYPGTVTFADGENQATFTVLIDTSVIKGRVDYNVKLTIADGLTTPYYTDQITYTLNYAPWTTVTGIDKDGNVVDKALYREDLVASVFGLEVVEYEVEMQENPENPNIIRLVDPYGEACPYSAYGIYDDSQKHYMYFNITNPNAVFMCNKDGKPLGSNPNDFFFHTGLQISADGEIWITTFYDYTLATGDTPTADMVGTLKQGNLTFGTDMMLVAFSEDNGLYYGNSNGGFRIIWPGAEPYADPATTWHEIGTGQFTDGILYPLAIMEDPSEEIPTYDVTVMEYGIDSGIYRIMNPWKAGICPYGVDYSGDKYIEVDASNPDCVVMELQSTGLSFSTGALYIMNYAYYMLNGGATANDVISYGVNDTLKDGVLYSAPGNLLWGLVANGQLQGLSQGEYAWQLVMPEATEASATAKQAPAKHFNGNGPLKLNESAKSSDSKFSWSKPIPAISYGNKTIDL